MQKLDTLVEAVDRGQPIDLRTLPPPPGQCNDFKQTLYLKFELLSRLLTQHILKFLGFTQASS